MIRLALIRLQEKVSPDCSDGGGVAFEFQGWEIIRTTHLDAIRNGIQRDYGYNCEKFKKVISLFFNYEKLKNGKYNLLYKENNLYQEMVVSVYKNQRKVKIVTIISGNRIENDYSKKERSVYIGEI